MNNTIHPKLEQTIINKYFILAFSMYSNPQTIIKITKIIHGLPNVIFPGKDDIKVVK